jgi:hypothetical protein
VAESVTFAGWTESGCLDASPAEARLAVPSDVHTRTRGAARAAGRIGGIRDRACQRLAVATAGNEEQVRRAAVGRARRRPLRSRSDLAGAR